MRTRPWQDRPTSGDGLFDTLAVRRPETAPVRRTALRTAPPVPEALVMSGLSELHGVFDHAVDPADPAELLRLFVGDVESSAPPIGRFGRHRREWAAATLRRRLPHARLLAQPAMPQLVKSVFDFYFRDDLYGHWDQRSPIVLSSGSYDETLFGLPESLKNCIRYALNNNWYGYSDSLGRTSAREALALLETARSGGQLSIGADRVAVTLGGTAALASIVDLLTGAGRSDDRPALCGIPNYPPLVAAVARRMAVRCVDTPIAERHTDITPLIEQARGGARLILLQTVTNPSGLRVPESQLAELIAAAPADCVIVLDECHDTFGPAVALTPARMAANVISIRSISKRWGAPGLKAGWLVAAPEFIDEFYVHASTTYGGPPSLFYLLLEMLGLFEAARFGGGLDVDDLLGRLSGDYRLNRGTLAAGFADYARTADLMARRVLRCRERAVDALGDMGVPVLAPDYSINLLARLGDEPSYLTYRRVVEEAGVSVYPGLLCMAGGPGLVRLSPCVPEQVLDEAMARLGRWVGRRSWS
ncbi:pyridoxal phosphate-dependent aminotransferase [Krasilnikovia sp. MM14-A1259]|uniref:pyridoxal phosphate-dependent aminotransferase n=1 Tax=Krasilnikovia sp. MM14-A1259 TaxID=3373539 RepID=UPI0038094F8F